MYARGLHWTLHHRAVAVAIGALLAAVSLVAYQRVETGFVPSMDEGAFVLDYWAPPGAALGETERMLTQVDAILRATPEVANFARRTGAELGFFLTESNRGDLLGALHTSRGRDSEAVIEDVRQRIEAQVPGLRVEFVQVLQDMIGDLSGNPSPIEIKLFGDDPAVLRSWRREVTGAHRRHPRRRRRRSTASPPSGRPTTSTSTPAAPRSPASTPPRCSTGCRPPSPAPSSARCWRATAPSRCACATRPRCSSTCGRSTS